MKFAVKVRIQLVCDLGTNLMCPKKQKKKKNMRKSQNFPKFVLYIVKDPEIKYQIFIAYTVFEPMSS